MFVAAPDPSQEPTDLISIESIPIELFADCPGLVGPSNRERDACSGLIVVDREDATPADYEHFALRFCVAA